MSERGQIAIPVEARRDFDIQTGDKLLVMGDLEKGIALAKASKLIGSLSEMLEMFRSAPDADQPEEAVDASQE